MHSVACHRARSTQRMLPTTVTRSFHTKALYLTEQNPPRATLKIAMLR